MILQIVPHVPGQEVRLHADGALPWRGAMDHSQRQVGVPHPL